MKDIVIIGAGGHASEVVWLAKRCGRVITGFLDNTPEKQNTFYHGFPVLGALDDCSKFMDCDFIVAIGSPYARQKVIKAYFQDINFTFATLIDPSALIGENIRIGEGGMICAGSILTVDVAIGIHCLVNTNAVLSHGVIGGDFVTVSPNASILGNVCLGDMVEVGANATIKEKLTIQDGAMIGMGAVVTKDVAKNHVMVGNPAKLLKVIG